LHRRRAEQDDIVAFSIESLLQIVPSGKAPKKVAISLLTTSGLLSYRGTHCVTTPPGFRCRLHNSKYSRVYRAAEPRTQGWIGSEVITSNLSWVVRM
jgi:hypothetical protein